MLTGIAPSLQRETNAHAYHGGAFRRLAKRDSPKCALEAFTQTFTFHGRPHLLNLCLPAMVRNLQIYAERTAMHRIVGFLVAGAHGLERAFDSLDERTFGDFVIGAAADVHPRQVKLQFGKRGSARRGTRCVGRAFRGRFRG